MVRLLFWIFSRPPGISVRVSRPTTTDGEVVELATTVPVGATPQKIAHVIETCSLAIQRRLAAQNELLARTDAEVAWEKWKRVKAKVDEGAKLSIAERKWWLEHSKDFTEEGPVAGADMRKAAHGD